MTYNKQILTYQSLTEYDVMMIYDDTEPSLEELQGLVGGYIQVVESHDGKADIVMDEEGKLKGKSVNMTATAYWLGTDNTDEWEDVIVGDVVVLKNRARLS